MTVKTIQPKLPAAPPDSRTTKDLRTLGRFIEVFCQGQHGSAQRSEVTIAALDITGTVGRPIMLCENCARLCAHAFVKRLHCRFDDKPECKHCPNQCYHPRHQQQIRQVMKYSGRKLLMRGRLDYLLHLIT